MRDREREREQDKCMQIYCIFEDDDRGEFDKQNELKKKKNERKNYKMVEYNSNEFS